MDKLHGRDFVVNVNVVRHRNVVQLCALGSRWRLGLSYGRQQISDEYWATRQRQEHTTRTYTSVVWHSQWWLISCYSTIQLGCGRHFITRGKLHMMWFLSYLIIWLRRSKLRGDAGLWLWLDCVSFYSRSNVWPAYKTFLKVAGEIGARMSNFMQNCGKKYVQMACDTAYTPLLPAMNNNWQNRSK